jgi:hypothetical protein
VLAALYRLVICESHQGNDALLIANDADQAAQDLILAKRLVARNPNLAAEVEVLADEIRRRDGCGSLQVLSGRNAIGLHGRTALFLGYDEVHGMRNWDVFEALAPDPHRRDVLTWVSSYDSIFNSPGNPLHDLKVTAQRGDDPRMLVSWFSADWCTDPNFAHLEGEQRANPSIASFAPNYLEDEKRRLPVHRFRRLHLNLPGAPEGAAFNADAVLACVRAECPRAGSGRTLFRVRRHVGRGARRCGAISTDATRKLPRRSLIVWLRKRGRRRSRRRPRRASLPRSSGRGAFPRFTATAMRARRSGISFWNRGSCLNAAAAIRQSCTTAWSRY